MPVTLAELAIHIPASIRLFEKYDLDYYQKGNQLFRDACKEKGLSYDKIDSELTVLQNASKVSTMTLEDMSLERLIDFINGQYHNNETQILYFIHSHIEKLLAETTEKSTLVSLKEMEVKFRDLMEKLIQHCKREDELLFPYMRKLNGWRKEKSKTYNSLAVKLIENPIKVLEAEHVQAAQILAEIKKTANNFKIPADASANYKILMESLKEFETDLHMHLHIENNILFPKIKELEEELNKTKP